MTETFNAIHQTDCITGMQQLPDGCVDLAFADPPFNIGYEYDEYDDRKAADEYLDWSHRWMSEVVRVLKPDGTVWLAIGDEYAAELKVKMTRELGLTCRSWVIWYYTFGVNCTNKFSRSHAHLFHMVKDPQRFTFNADDPDVRVPSARQLVYADKRANPKGRLPDDTWIMAPEVERRESRVESQAGEPGASATGDHEPRPARIPPAKLTHNDWVLRPQDVPEAFQENEDVWYFPRVNGTFKERAGWHGCQMPEQLLGRIIRACSHADEIVLDPFTGSGTTLAVAKKLGRRYLGYELSTDYAARAKERLQSITPGDPLNGVENPLTSVSDTSKGRRRGSVKRREKSVVEIQNVETAQKTRSRFSKKDLRGAIVAAFEKCHDGFSSDYVIANPVLNAEFIDGCRRLGVPNAASEINLTLMGIRKSGKLGVTASRRIHVPSSHVDQYIFASEIAARKLADSGYSLDEVLCTPALAEEFDRIAGSFAPGFCPFDYRWAALRVRKAYHESLKAIESIPASVKNRRGAQAGPVFELNTSSIPSEPGVYLLEGAGDNAIYSGETENLRKRMESHFFERSSDTWREIDAALTVRIIQGIDELRDALRSRLVLKHNPLLNYRLTSDTSVAI